MIPDTQNIRVAEKEHKRGQMRWVSSNLLLKIITIARTWFSMIQINFDFESKLELGLFNQIFFNETI